MIVVMSYAIVEFESWLKKKLKVLQFRNNILKNVFM